MTLNGQSCMHAWHVAVCSKNRLETDRQNPAPCLHPARCTLHTTRGTDRPLAVTGSAIQAGVDAADTDAVFTVFAAVIIHRASPTPASLYIRTLYPDYRTTSAGRLDTEQRFCSTSLLILHCRSPHIHPTRDRFSTVAACLPGRSSASCQSHLDFAQSTQSLSRTVLGHYLSHVYLVDARRCLATSVTCIAQLILDRSQSLDLALVHKPIAATVQSGP